jgi:hypothetical protein
VVGILLLQPSCILNFVIKASFCILEWFCCLLCRSASFKRYDLFGYTCFDCPFHWLYSYCTSAITLIRLLLHCAVLPYENGKL